MRSDGTRADAPGGSNAAAAAILIGVGLGGLFDGIVMHQILQWHHLVSSHVPPTSLANLELNTLADGLFHAVAWVVSLLGVTLLWRAARRGVGIDMSHFLGGLLAGWGGFNVVEGVVDHHLLGLHHVRPGPDQLLYDVAFLMWGAAMLIIGWLLLRRRAVRSSVA